MTPLHSVTARQANSLPEDASGGLDSSAPPNRPSRRHLSTFPMASTSLRTPGKDAPRAIPRRARQVKESAPPIINHRRPVPRLSNLECVATLGAGSWGSVYLVRTRATERSNTVMALKCVEKRAHRDCERNDQREDREEAAQFKHMERRTLATIPWNPFVLGLVDAYTDPRNLYLLLELAPRGSLYQFINRDETLEDEAVKFYYANVVLAIEFLHSHGIVHRDIKNENILIGADGYAVLTDFGLATYVDTKVFDRMGTPLLYSPEYIKGAAEKPSASAETRFAVDWWAATCSLFELLTDRLPFRPFGREYEDVLKEIEAGNIQWPGGSAYTDVMKDFVTSMLEPDPAARKGSVSTPSGEGNKVVNKYIRQHEWMSSIRWDRIEARIEVAPPVPTSIPTLRHQWKLHVLPQQRKVPGMTIKRGRTFDEAGPALTGDVNRPSKRRRTTTVSSLLAEVERPVIAACGSASGDPH